MSIDRIKTLSTSYLLMLESKFVEFLLNQNYPWWVGQIQLNLHDRTERGKTEYTNIRISKSKHAIHHNYYLVYGIF